mmetsp:Transcript_6483/g.12030  ORF Transcript_6483/g.12030 Transcript_6483/m.12030 type:complete len:429 (-) Transcript_6483:42-1328(-)
MALEMKRFTASGGRILGILLAVRGYSGFVIALAFQALEPIDHDRRNAFLAAEPMLPMNTSTDGHPPGADYERETQIALGHKAARLPMSMEVCVATFWVLMVVAMPMVSIRMSGQNVTRTVIITTGTMLLSFLGGIWLFTNILLFQSSHFEGHRSLTLVECVYVMAQVLTTVGYGDITPARPRAQVFVAMYVLFNLLLIAKTVSEVAGTAAEQLWRIQEASIVTAASSVRRIVSSPRRKMPKMGTLEFDTMELTSILKNKVPPLPWKAVQQKFTNWLFFVCLGIVFYANYPGEVLTAWQSVYYSIITLSTVGFGAVTPVTAGGKVFGAFWMLFGSFSLLGLVGAFTEMMCVLRSHEKWRIQKENVDEDELFRELPDELDLQAFMEFSVEYSSLVKKEELQQILGTYEELRKQCGRRSITRDQALALYER